MYCSFVKVCIKHILFYFHWSAVMQETCNIWNCYDTHCKKKQHKNYRDIKSVVELLEQWMGRPIFKFPLGLQAYWEILGQTLFLSLTYLSGLLGLPSQPQKCEWKQFSSWIRKLYIWNVVSTGTSHDAIYAIFCVPLGILCRWRWSDSEANASVCRES